MNKKSLEKLYWRKASDSDFGETFKLLCVTDWRHKCDDFLLAMKHVSFLTFLASSCLAMPKLISCMPWTWLFTGKTRCNGTKQYPLHVHSLCHSSSLQFWLIRSVFYSFKKCLCLSEWQCIYHLGTVLSVAFTCLYSTFFYHTSCCFQNFLHFPQLCFFSCLLAMFGAYFSGGINLQLLWRK